MRMPSPSAADGSARFHHSDSFVSGLRRGTNCGSNSAADARQWWPEPRLGRASRRLPPLQPPRPRDERDHQLLHELPRPLVGQVERRRRTSGPPARSSPRGASPPARRCSTNDLPQVILHPRRAEDPAGDAHQRTGLPVPTVVPGRPGAPVDGVLEDAGDGVVVLGTAEEEGVRGPHGGLQLAHRGGRSFSRSWLKGGMPSSSKISMRTPSGASCCAARRAARLYDPRRRLPGMPQDGEEAVRHQPSAVRAAPRCRAPAPRAGPSRCPRSRAPPGARGEGRPARPPCW